MSSPAVTDRVLAACEPARGRWVSGARHGLSDRVLARSAAEVFDIAYGELDATGAPSWVLEQLGDMTERQVLMGRCPADDPDLDPGAAAAVDARQAQVTEGAR